MTKERADELMALFSDESVRTVVRPLVEELAELEDRIREVKALPMVRVHPKDPSVQKSTAAGRLYKDLLAKQTDIVRMLLRQLNRDGDADEDSPLRQYLKSLEGRRWHTPSISTLSLTAKSTSGLPGRTSISAGSPTDWGIRRRRGSTRPSKNMDGRTSGTRSWPKG